MISIKSSKHLLTMIKNLLFLFILIILKLIFIDLILKKGLVLINELRKISKEINKNKIIKKLNNRNIQHILIR
jgi:hypothetical protein